MRPSTLPVSCCNSWRLLSKNISLRLHTIVTSMRTTFSSIFPTGQIPNMAWWILAWPWMCRAGRENWICRIEHNHRARPGSDRTEPLPGITWMSVATAAIGQFPLGFSSCSAGQNWIAIQCFAPNIGRGWTCILLVSLRCKFLWKPCHQMFPYLQGTAQEDCLRSFKA
eukprot:symbB.v1.2.011913.t1/scaffold794.1/size161992/6